jgi:hypothetical protein
MSTGIAALLAWLTATMMTVPWGPLPFWYDIYTFRGEGGRTEVVAAFAVRAGALQREEADHRARYRFDVSFIVTDTTVQRVTRSDDSVYVRIAGRSSLPRDHLIHTWVTLEADPSRDTHQRVIMTDATTPGVGQMYQAPFSIPDYGGPNLMLSDVALGLPDADRGWSRGGASLALLPTSRFPSSAFDVYYEIYNLPAGRAYRTEISIASIEPGDRGTGGTPAVRTVFSGRSATVSAGTVAERRRVESALPRGRYRLTVTVTDEATGDVTSRARDFDVQGWRSGTTLVPALPRRDFGTAGAPDREPR